MRRSDSDQPLDSYSESDDEPPEMQSPPNLSSSSSELVSAEPPLPTDDFDDIDAIMKAALDLPIRHSWVADFLFHDDASQMNLPDLICGIQSASAALIDLSIHDLPKHTHQSHSENKDRTTRRGGAAKFASDKFCLIPILSRDSITLGILVRRNEDLEAASNGPYAHFSFHTQAKDDSHLTTCARCAYDNKTTAMLTTVISPDNPAYTCVNFIVNSATRGQVLFTFRFRIAVRKMILEKAKDGHPLSDLVDTVIVHQEKREKCFYCKQPVSDNCSCVHTTNLPEHPLDYSVFARNIVLYAGTYPMALRIWLRSSAGLMKLPTQDTVRCDISVSVNHESVSELCDLARSELVSRSGTVSAENLGENPEAGLSYPDQMQVESGSSQTGTHASHAWTSGAAGFHSGSHQTLSSNLRKIRNREAAARSNLKRKERMDLLKSSLAEARNHLSRLLEEEERLKAENKELRRRTAHRE